MTDQPDAPKSNLARRTFDKATTVAVGLAGVAGEAAKTMVDVAGGTARAVVEAAGDATATVVEVAGERARTALELTSSGASMVAHLAEGGARVSAQIASGTARIAAQIAQETALQMAQTYLGKSTLTLALPENLINKHLREMAKDYSYIDYVTVDCGKDRLTVALDGHHERWVYTVTLQFDVLECKVSHDEKFLLLRLVDEGLDVQMREANLLSNFAIRQVAKRGFKVANKLPVYAPMTQLLERFPGLSQEGPRLWRVALHESHMIDLLNNRSWMVDKLMSLSDLSVLPGLSILKDSREMLIRLVNQFEIRSMRVLPGRLEVLIGINTD
jgi:hypothetical protein